MATYLASLLLRNCSNIENLLWISDRGNETTAFEELMFDMYNLSSLTLKSIYNMPELKISGIAKENKETNKFEFDELIKIPDYFAGIIAAFDFKNISIEEKFKDLLVNSIADNDRCIIIALKVTSGKLKCFNLDINKNSP